MEIYKELTEQLDEQLKLICTKTTSLAKQAKWSIAECILFLEKLKHRVIRCSFKTQEQEIHFFKHIKPNISGKLIFYIQQFNIETRKPNGTDKQIRKYYSNHLQNINRFMDDNIAFYQYLRTDSNFMDDKYFVRNQNNLHLILDQHSYNFDITFNTSHDNKVAQIVANDLLIEYLLKQINQLEQNLFSESTPVVATQEIQLKWTDSKVALIELIYALHTYGSLNKGTLELKELTQTLSAMFNIELGDFYRTWAEIKLRKEPTKYLDALKVCLENKIKVDLQ